jgi:hypothetical protein
MPAPVADFRNVLRSIMLSPEAAPLNGLPCRKFEQKKSA